MYPLSAGVMGSMCSLSTLPDVGKHSGTITWSLLPGHAATTACYLLVQFLAD